MMRLGHAISWHGAALLALPALAVLLVANRSYDVVGGRVPLPLLSPHAPGPEDLRAWEEVKRGLGLGSKLPTKQGGDTGPVLRSAVFDTAWGRAAVEQLRIWRSTLFLRTAQLYTAEEQRATRGGKRVFRVEPQGWRRYDTVRPIVGCPNGSLRQVGGKGDGSKWLCVDGLLDRPGCIIYSLGSNGQFEYEEAMLKETSCAVHTFDCTYAGRSLDGNKRHFYHQVCLGRQTRTVEQEGTKLQFWDYSTILTKLGHSREAVTLLKVDIEGYEFDTLSGWLEQEACSFPQQIAMEVHFSRLYNIFKTASGKEPVSDADFTNLFWPRHELSLGEISLFFGHFANLGYAVVSREDNPLGPECCAEFTLLKVEQPANCTA